MGSSIGGLVGGIAGSFLPIPGGTAIGAAAGSVLGGAIGGSQNAGSAAQAQNNAGQSIYNAGQAGQQAAQFNPIGLTTNFGSSNFVRDPATGRITEAGYTLNPQLTGIQAGVLGNAAGYNPAQLGQAAQPLYQGASSLFGLGQNYLGADPNAVAQNWLRSQQNLLAPGRAQEEAAVANQQFQTGRTGLAVGGTSMGYGGAGSPGLMATNPQVQAMYNARARQDAELAAQAEQQARTQIGFGAGLMQQGGTLLGQVPSLTSAGYAPLNTMLGTASTIEGLGQNAFDMSTALGAGQSTANANAARIGVGAAQAAAPYQVTGQSYNPLGTFLSAGNTPAASAANMNKVGEWFGDIIGGGQGMGLLNSSSSSQDYMNSIGATSSGPFNPSYESPWANEAWF